jgi:hypothetical protein
MSADGARRVERVRLLLDERSCDDGFERTFLTAQEGGLALAVELHVMVPGGPKPSEPTAALLPLPANAVNAVLRRYGKPIDEALDAPRSAELQLSNGAGLAAFRHRARFDVIALDYLLYTEPGAEPLAALARPVAAALRHLADALRRGAGGEPR